MLRASRSSHDEDSLSTSLPLFIFRTCGKHSLLPAANSSSDTLPHALPDHYVAGRELRSSLQ